MASPGLLHVALVLLVVFCVLAVLLCALLVAIRTTRLVTERRGDRRRAVTRALLLDVLLGEEAEAEAARSVLLQRRGGSWERTEEQIFEMVPKLRGEARAELIEVLASKGTGRRARRASRSLSAVRRCRGVFALGVLGDAASLPAMVAMLGDRSFLVRRTAVRALGNLGDPAAVHPLLELVGREGRLARDVVYALDRIGPPAGPRLREELLTAVEDRRAEHPEADLAATVLGLIGDLGAADALARGLRAGRAGLDVACAEALGQVGNAANLPDLLGALDHGRLPLRVAAAEALGLLGSAEAVEGLRRALEEDDPLLSRAAAGALCRLGDRGMAALERSPSRYARETVAIAELRAARQGSGRSLAS